MLKYFYQNWLGQVLLSAFFLLGVCEAKGEREPSKEEAQMVYYKEMIEWLKENFEYRAELLEKHTEKSFDLDYDYQSSSLKDEKLREWIGMLQERRLPKSQREKKLKEAEKHAKACLTELEKIRASLATAEALASKEWLKKEGVEKTDEIKGQIFGTDIDAEHLGVILDNSGSMEPYLDKLKAEIATDFSNAYTIEVRGCNLSESFNFPWYFCTSEIYGNPFHADLYIPSVPMSVDFDVSHVSNNVPGAFQAMIDIIQADVIYWFCDFNGEFDDDIMDDLSEKILKSKVTLFVHTSDEDPPREIAKLVKESGGKIIKKDF